MSVLPPTEVVAARSCASKRRPRAASTGDRPGKRRREREAGEGGLRVAGARGLACSRANPRLCDMSVTGILHSTTIPAGIARPVVSCMRSMVSTTQGSGFGAALSCCAGSARVRWRPLPPFPSPATFTGWVRVVAGSPEPVVDLRLRPNPRLCVESVAGKLHSTTTPAPGPSRVVLTMLCMHNTTGLAIPAGIVVLRRFWSGCDGARSPFPFPSAV